MLNQTVFEKGEVSNSSFGGTTTVLAAKLNPTPTDPNFYPSAARAVSQRVGLGSKSSTLVASDTGGVISYTSNPTTGSWGDNYGVICNRYIPGNGAVSVVRGTAGNIMISFRPDGVLTSDFQSATHVAFTSAGTVYYKTDAAGVVAIPAATFEIGDRLILARTGTTVTISKLVGDTGAEVLLYTFPETSSGNIYGHYNIDAAGVLYNPQIRGAIWDVEYGTSTIITDGNSITSGTNQVTPWPTRLKARVPFNVAGCSLSNFAVSGQNIASMEGDAAAQIDTLFDINDASVVIALELGNQIVATGSSARVAADLMKAYCRRRLMAGFRVILCTAFDRKQDVGGGVGTGAVSIIQAANAFLLAEWNECATDVIDTRLVPELRDSSNLTYFDAVQVHPNDLALTGFIDLVAGVLINANPTTAGAVS